MTEPPQEGQDLPEHDRPSYGQPQYGVPSFPGQNHPSAPGQQPHNTTNLILGLVLGGGIGLVVGGIATLSIYFGIAGQDSTGGGGTTVLLAVLLPFLLPLPLFFFRHTRPWAGGLLMGIALGSVVLAGSCVWLIDELSQQQHY